MAAARASHYLSQNNNALQKSLERLSSGKRINQPADDAGGLAVSMKLSGTINRLSGAESNVANAISYLQVQDGILESAGNIVRRMGELKGLYGDVLKNTTDKATYDAEFADLQMQLYQIAQTQFNGVSLFGNVDDAGAGASALNNMVFDAENYASGAVALPDNGKLDVFTTADGSSGSSVAIHKSLLLSAMTVDANSASNQFGNSVAYGDRTKVPTTVLGAAAGNGGTNWSFAAEQSSEAFSLALLNTSVFATALENIATLRANNGGQVSRLQYAQESILSQKTNLEAANGRIIDVDIARESTNLAKQNILVQASASMVSQATMINDVALMLLR